MYGLKFLREFNFADYRLFAFHGNNLREFQLDFRLLCWEQIFWIFADFIYGTCIKQKQNAMFWFNFCLTNVGQMLKPVKRALTLSKIFMGSFTTLTYTTELIVWSIIKIKVNVNWSYIKSDVCFSWSPFQLKNQLSATKKGKVEESDEDFTPGSVRKSWVFYIVNCLRLETGQRLKLENSQRKTDFVKLRENSWNFLSSQRNSKFREFWYSSQRWGCIIKQHNYFFRFYRRTRTSTKKATRASSTRSKRTTPGTVDVLPTMVRERRIFF